MRARELFERAAAPAPVETPAPTKPTERPGSPARPAPKHPNPFRRRLPGRDPGPMPKPKACVETKARSLFSEGQKRPLWPHTPTPAERSDKQFKETHRSEIEARAAKAVKAGAPKAKEVIQKTNQKPEGYQGMPSGWMRRSLR